jgi:hypothetical protein
MELLTKLTKKQALKNAGYVPVMGRPSVGSELLPALTVSGELRAALEKKAESSGRSVPETRREAYRKFTE